MISKRTRVRLAKNVCSTHDTLLSIGNAARFTDSATVFFWSNEICQNIWREYLVECPPSVAQHRVIHPQRALNTLDQITCTRHIFFLGHAKRHLSPPQQHPFISLCPLLFLLFLPLPYDPKIFLYPTIVVWVVSSQVSVLFLRITSDLHTCPALTFRGSY